MKLRNAILLALALIIPLSVYAKPKKKTYNNSADQLFAAALRTARERHVVTYVDEKTLTLTFETGRSFTSNGFVANASVEPEGENKATLIVNVQNKQGVSWGAGDRMSDKFFEQVTQELSGETRQKSDVRVQETHVAVPDPKAVPPEPSMTAPAASGAAPEQKSTSTLLLSSTPDGAEVYVDDAFVGNAPATLHLDAGKHSVRISQTGYKDWKRDVTSFAGSEAHLSATLEKQ